MIASHALSRLYVSSEAEQPSIPTRAFGLFRDDTEGDRAERLPPALGVGYVCYPDSRQSLTKRHSEPVLPALRVPEILTA
jgi:hypothetical protein